MKSKPKRWLIVFFQISLLLASSALFASEHTWGQSSGLWEEYTLDNGNSVLRQGRLQARPADLTSPIPYLEYNTLHLRSARKRVRGADQIRFTFRVQNIEGSQGEIAIFLGGKNYKEMYYLTLHYNKNLIHRIALRQTTILDADKPLHVAGNYKSSLIADKNLSFAMQTVEVKIVRRTSALSLYLDNQLVFQYQRKPGSAWQLLPDLQFAIGAKQSVLWIDNVLFARAGRILFRENFTKPSVHRIILKLRLLNSSDNSTTTAPR